MRIKYFIGVEKDGIKRAFRKLSLKYHPDRGGTTTQFIALKEEYEYVVAHQNNLSFPLKEDQNIGMTFDDTLSAFTQAAQATRQKDPQDIFRAAQEARQQRQAAYWANMKMGDPIYDVIDDLIELKHERGFKLSSFLRQVHKIEDLEMDHFKYMAYRFKYKQYWAIIKYEEYLTGQSFRKNMFDNGKR